MSPKYRVLLAVLLTLAALCSHAVFGQTKIVEKIVHVDANTIDVALNLLQPKDCKIGPGAISITASGGTGKYTYAWSGPAGFTSTNEDITGLAEGSYTVRVTDDSGCTASRTWQVLLNCVVDCNLRDVAAITNTKTCTSTDGAIAVTITGGSGVYTYTWYDQNFNILAATKDVGGLASGAYYLEVSDANAVGCTTFFYYSIASSFNLSATSTPNSRCAAPFTGQIVAGVSGGSGNYTFTWRYPDGTSVAGGATASALRGGSYTITVRDNVLGCTAETSVFLSNTAAATLAVSGTTTSSTTCEPGNGAVDITVAGGSGNYGYTWYNQSKGTFASSTEDLANARAATYSIYVLDNVSGCNTFKMYVVDDRSVKPAFTVATTANTACSAPFTGAIDLTVTDATAYRYAWSNGATTEDIAAAAPGTYDVTVTDKNTGCAASALQADIKGIVVADSSDRPLHVTVEAVGRQTTCATPNGSIQASIQSTVTPTVAWTGPNGFSASTPSIAGLTTGDYRLTVSVPCNAPPVIEARTLVTQTNSTLNLNLLDIISDPDNNLDVSTVEIVDHPSSGATAVITGNLELSIQYRNSFYGTDQMRIRACDVLNACAENTLNVQVNVEFGVIVYNAVAPRSPGNNKFMRIEHLPAGTNRVSIFNRWGDKVFETENYTNEVPGRRFEGLADNGKELPSGTYFYKIEFADATSPLTGYLSLKQ